MSDTISFLKQQNVTLSAQQIQKLQQMNLTLIDLGNINLMTSEFTEFCQVLQLTFGPKIKLKSAIIKLQSHKNQETNITYDTNNEIKTDDKLQTLVSMGFTAQQSIFALDANQQDVVKATEMLTTTNLSSQINNSTTKPAASFDRTIRIPVGSIIAWHKHLCKQQLALPNDAWIECNGQTIEDEQSIFNAQTVPNLNGERRFLRGGARSGVIEEDQLKKHTHSGKFQIMGGNESNITWNLGARSTWRSGPVSETGGEETRPKNMSIVWIMRIK